MALAKVFLRVLQFFPCQYNSNNATYLLTYLLHGEEFFLRRYLVLQLVKKVPAFLEPEGSSQYSQVPATCPYPEPTPSSSYNPLLLSEDPS